MKNLKQPPSRPVLIKPTHVPKFAVTASLKTFTINFTYHTEALGPIVLFVRNNTPNSTPLDSIAWEVIEGNREIPYTTENTLQRTVDFYQENGEKKNEIGRIPMGDSNILNPGTTYALIDAEDTGSISLPENSGVYNYIRNPKVPKISVVFLKNEIPILLSEKFDFEEFASTDLGNKLYFGIAEGNAIQGISKIDDLTFQELSPNQQSLVDGQYFALDYTNIEGGVVNISLKHNSSGYFFEQE